LKIQKLYSNQDNFEVLNFKDGFNMVVGGKLNNTNFIQHNVGKTLLLEIIDFCFLCDFGNEKNLYKNVDALSDYSFYVLIKLINDKYITLNRSISYPNIIKIIFHNNSEIFNDTSKFEEKTLKDAKDYLSSYFSDLYGYNIDFRKSFKRFIRYSDQYHNPIIIDINKNYNKKDKDYLPGLMNVFRLDYNIIYSFFESKEKISVLKKKITGLKLEYEITGNKINIQKKIDKLDRELMTLQKEINTKQEDQDLWRFQITDSETIDSLCKEINVEIDELNKSKYYLNKRIDKAKNTLKIDLKSNFVEEFDNLYAEIQLVFTNEIKKSINDLVTFNHQLLGERKIIAKEQIKKNQSELDQIKARLNELYNLRSEKIKLLQNTDIKEKCNKTKEEIDNLKHQLFIIEEDKNKYTKMINYFEIQEELDKTITQNLQYYNEILNNNTYIKKLCKEFSTEIYTSISSSININFNNKKPSIELTDKDGH